MNEHLKRGEMLALLDGELSARAMRRAEAHLHSCWTCRGEVERLEADLGLILRSHREVFSVALPQPTQSWLSFEQVLQRCGPKARPTLRQKLEQLIPWPGELSFIAGACLLVAVFLLVYPWKNVKSVSAQEIILRVHANDVARSNIGKDQYAHSSLHIRRMRVKSSREDAVSLELWKSKTAMVWDGPADAPLEIGLRNLYEQNHIPFELPLSASSVDDWQRSLQAKMSVRSDSGSFVLMLGSNAQVQPRTIEFRINPEDWSIQEMNATLGDEHYVVSQGEQMLVAGNLVPPLVLARLIATPLPQPREPAVAMQVAGPALPVGAPVDLYAAQVGVLAALHGATADLGEPIHVRPGANTIQIDLSELTEDRRGKIRTALHGLPAVSILETPKASVKTTRSSPPSTIVMEGGDDAASQLSGQNYRMLVKFTGSEAGEEQFAEEAMSESTLALAHLYALRNLAVSAPATHEEGLSEKDRETLDRIAEDHERESEQALRALQARLAPLSASLSLKTPDREMPNSGLRWQESSADLLEAGRRADTLLRGALTTNTSPVALKTALPQIQAAISTVLNGLNVSEKKSF